ncbi:MAG TPA: hypothetical protein VG406_08970 [Isosphaeraceae bacterium]|jgi:hypothetical protein|nr:hypothetical protein [Isosphaeraceae bacterium]
MEVSPTGQAPQPAAAGVTEPVALLHLLANLQSQTLELQRQSLDMQRQQLDLARELAQVSREQRQRQFAELERWQAGHEGVIDHCREALGQLEQVHAALMGDLANYVDDNHEHLIEGDFALSDFVDRFGPRLAHLNTMLAILRPLTANLPKKAEG